MLILTRRPGEKIIVDHGTVEIEVLSVRHGNQVKLGVKAPPGVAIHREEVEERIRAESEEGSKG